jgi:hypothetical protein
MAVPALPSRTPIKPAHKLIPAAELMRSANRHSQTKPCAGEFEGRHSASQRGVWGSEPPDPGF